MRVDAQLVFSNQQIITGATNIVSDNLVDAYGPNSLGKGQEIYWFLEFVRKVNIPIATVILVGADDSSFLINYTIISTVGPLTLSGTNLLLQVVRTGVPAHTPKQFYRCEYTIDSAVKRFDITSFLTIYEQTNQSNPA